MKSNHTKISLIVTTYNRPDALNAVVRSIFRQSELPYEIIIADDGSKNETKELIEKLSNTSPVTIIHSWQEDNGFRLSASRNRAIAKASGEYIVLIDGDMLLHKDYIKDYRKAITKNRMYISSRVMLSDRFTKKLEIDVKNNTETNLNICLLSNGIIKNRENRVRIPNLWKQLKPITKYTKAKGYMGFWREDAIAVNGFDEAYEGWGREDSDFLMRMINNNIEARQLKFSAIAYHMYHVEASKENEFKNHKMLEIVIDQKIKECKDGIKKYL